MIPPDVVHLEACTPPATGIGAALGNLPASPVAQASAAPARRRSPFWSTVAARYARWRIGRSLEGVYVAGLDAARRHLAEGPVLFASTHVAWWDGLVMKCVDAALHADGHVLLDAPTLDRLPWLGRLGALPIDRRGWVTARRDLRHAAAVLDRPGRALWFFPQGRQRPSWLRPLDLQPGITFLARHRGVRVIPVALQYGFREDARPAAVLHLGEPVAAAALEEALLLGLAAGDRFLDHGGEPFSSLFPGARVARVDHGAGARLLARFSGGTS